MRLALAEAIGAFRHLDSLGTLIQLLGDRHLRVRRAASESLWRLTGRDLGTSQTRWKSWLEEQDDSFTLPSRTVAEQMRAAALPSGKRYAPTPFFGLEIPSDHVVFVLDKSESMYHGRWDSAVKQARIFLEGADVTTHFGLIEFDEHVRAWREKLSAAKPGHVELALRFLDRTRPTGATDIVGALRAALRVKRADTLVLLSDGLSNRGEPHEPDAIRATMLEENRYARLSIHTIQLLPGRRIPHDAPPDAEDEPLSPQEKASRATTRRFLELSRNPLTEFLRELAREHEGSFSVGFADWRAPRPGAVIKPPVDR